MADETPPAPAPAPPATPPAPAPTAPPATPPAPSFDGATFMRDLDTHMKAWGEQIVTGIKEAFPAPPSPPTPDPPKSDPPKEDPPPKSDPPKKDPEPGGTHKSWAERWDGGRGWFR